MDEVRLAIVDEFKYLGATIDNFSTSHVSMLCKKIQKELNTLEG